MNKKSRIMPGVVVGCLIIGGGGYGIYANTQHQEQVRQEKLHTKKVNQEKKQVDMLQGKFKVTDKTAIETFNKISDLKLTTQEAKDLQEKFIREDKSKFDQLEKQNISKLKISNTDKQFTDIKALEANVSALQTELEHLKTMAVIFTEKEQNAYSEQLNELIKLDKAQITQLQKIAKEKADLEAKKKQEAETARIQAEKEASENQSSQSQNAVQEETQGNTAPYQSQQNSGNTGNASSGGSSGVIPGTNNGVGWASDPSQVPPGAVIQPPSSSNGWSANEDGSGKHDTNVNNNGDGTWTADPGNGNTGGWSVGG
jgi:hypothetical protein